MEPPHALSVWNPPLLCSNLSLENEGPPRCHGDSGSQGSSQEQKLRGELSSPPGAGLQLQWGRSPLPSLSLCPLITLPTPHMVEAWPAG